MYMGKSAQAKFTRNLIKHEKNAKGVRVTFFPTMITVCEWENIIATHQNICPCCKTYTEKFTVDHITPLALGGKSTVENIQPLCFQCNNSKDMQIIRY